MEAHWKQTFNASAPSTSQTPTTHPSIRSPSRRCGSSAPGGRATFPQANAVFATRSGKPISQRNVLRALRQAQKRAEKPDGKPTFPLLDEDGQVPPGVVPTFHGFRHSAASHAIAEGESVEEISWMLGHKNSLVTRQVYVQEVKSAERRARQRAAMEARYGGVLASATVPVNELADEGEVVPLRQAVG